MEKGKPIRFITSILLLGFSVQTLLISNGLLGVSLISLKKLCTCDHSHISNPNPSPQPEDQHFSVSKLPSSLSLGFTSEERNEGKAPSETFQPDPKESCHSSLSFSSDHGMNENEPHFCPHETSKQNVENTSLALNSIQLGQNVIQYFPPETNVIITIHSISSQIFEGFGNIPYEPPQA